MDVAALSTSLSQAQLQQNASAAITGLKLEHMENSKDQFLDLLESIDVENTEVQQITESHIGNNLDVLL